MELNKNFIVRLISNSKYINSTPDSQSVSQAYLHINTVSQGGIYV